MFCQRSKNMTLINHKSQKITILTIISLVILSAISGCTSTKPNDNDVFIDTVLQNSDELTKLYADLLMDWENYPLLKQRIDNIDISVDEHVEYVKLLCVSDELRECKTNYINSLCEFKQAISYLELSSHAFYTGNYESSSTYLHIASDEQNKSINNTKLVLQQITDYYEALT